MDVKFMLFAIIQIAKFSDSTPDFKGIRIPPISTYIVESDVCNIPSFDPWAFQELHENKSYVGCEKETPFVYFDTINGKIRAFVNETMRDQYRSNSMEVECCMSEIKRDSQAAIPDNNFKESPCEVINEKESKEVTNDVIRTLCYTVKGEAKANVYEDIHAFYSPKNLLKHHNLKNNGFSVLLIVIDSLSQANFIRQLPKTHDYLLRNNYVHLRGYGQVGMDGLSNILPLLTGYSERISRLIFGNPKRKFLDNLNFIWSDFEKEGYITSYAEDYSQKQAFYDKIKGFENPPTTYYFRKYTLSSDKLFTTFLDKMPHCTGPTLAAERILNLALDFAKTFRERNYFGLFWLNTFSKDDFNAPGRMDEKLLEFFEILHDYENDTITFFLSDSSYYNDDVTNSIYGWFESRMPFHYVHLPKSFLENNMEKYGYLRENSKRLISPYDIYATLQEILEISRDGYEAKTPRSCRNCTSIFKDISKERTCGNAGIDNYWCACLNKKHVLYETTNETNRYFLDV